MVVKGSNEEILAPFQLIDGCLIDQKKIPVSSENQGVTFTCCQDLSASVINMGSTEWDKNCLHYFFFFFFKKIIDLRE